MKTLNNPEVTLLYGVAARLERRAREMENARAFTDEARTQRRCMVVIYAEIANMLRAECEKLSNDTVSAGGPLTHKCKPQRTPAVRCTEC